METFSKIAACMVLFPVLHGCGTGGKEETSPAYADFPYVEVPQMITDAASQDRYALENYWNRFLDTSRNIPTDTASVSGISKDEFRKAFFIYASMAGSSSDPAGLMEKTTLKFIEFAHAEKDSLLIPEFAEMLCLVYYDPNSPARNDEILIPSLEAMLGTGAIGSHEAARYERMLRLAKKNRPGTTAADFEYATIGGEISNMHSIKADYIILLFNNPDCEACKTIIGAVSQSPKINGAIESGKVKVMAMYVDEDIRSWSEFAMNVPENWITAYDPTFSLGNGETYDLKAIPTLYLLDKDKTVLLKDADYRILAQALEEMI